MKYYLIHILHLKRKTAKKVFTLFGLAISQYPFALCLFFAYCFFSHFTQQT